MKKDIKLLNDKRFYFNNVKVFGRGGTIYDSINTHNTLSEDVLKEVKAMLADRFFISEIKNILGKEVENLNEQHELITELGDAYLNSKNYDKAEECFRWVQHQYEINWQTLTKGAADNLFKLGSTYHKMGVYHKAKHFYGESLSVYECLFEKRSDVITSDLTKYRTKIMSLILECEKQIK